MQINGLPVGRTAVLFFSELWKFSSLCSSMMLTVEHESASHPSSYPSGTLTRARFVYSDLEGEIRIGWSFLFLFLDMLGGWLWSRWRVFLVLFTFTYPREMTPFWTQTTCFSRGRAVWSWPFMVYTTELTCAFFLIVARWLGFAFILWVFFGWILLTQSCSGASFYSISWAWRSMSSLFTACSINCWSVHLYIIASLAEFLVAHSLRDFAWNHVKRGCEPTFGYLKP